MCVGICVGIHAGIHIYIYVHVYICMYVCMHARMYVCIICMHTSLSSLSSAGTETRVSYVVWCIHVRIHECRNASMYVCMHVRTHGCMYACMFCMYVFNVRTYACIMYMREYVCMCDCVYVYICPGVPLRSTCSYLHVHMHICPYFYICATSYVCMNRHIDIYIYMRIYIYTYTQGCSCSNIFRLSAYEMVRGSPCMQRCKHDFLHIVSCVRVNYRSALTSSLAYTPHCKPPTPIPNSARSHVILYCSRYSTTPVVTLVV